MRTKLCVAAAVCLWTLSAGAVNVTGKVVLKDASNNDREVGSSQKDGIPAGHLLKVVVQNARVRGRPAEGAQVEVTITQGREVKADGEMDLDGNGYGETLIQVNTDWLGEYHAEAVVDAGESLHAGGGYGRLEAEFRVVEAEPDPDMPEGLIVVFIVVGVGLTVLWWKKSRPASA